MSIKLPTRWFGLVLLAITVAPVRADPSPFDLAGPELEISVTRSGTTLPIAEIPNLEPGDQLQIKALLPSTQSENYIVVAAFLRGAINPPPPAWFSRCDTWTGPCQERGLSVVVPQGAQQVLVFLAPETGGDFRTLVNAVRGRPGAFVRASQDLNQATLDRSRLATYVSALHSLDTVDRTKLKGAAPLLARSLAIKVDDKCLDRIPELQVPCLIQGQDALILNDGHSTSIVEALTSGPAADLAMEASYSPRFRYGYYSPYVASVLDIARILGSIGTAQYQYIPALAAERGSRVSLSLNAPPSFHEPKSVLVAALPAVEAAQLPPLHVVDPKGIYCARRTALVLPVEGAPLVFATSFLHDMRLSVSDAGGKTITLPAVADAEQGGFVIDTSGLGAADITSGVSASLHGFWGFDRYDGPRFQLVDTGRQAWQVRSNEAAALVVGREGTVHLQSDAASCLKDLALRDAGGADLKPQWKALSSDEIEVKVPLQTARPGALQLLVSQYGAKSPSAVTLLAYSEPGHLDGFTLHAGDIHGLLRGSRLDQVARLTIRGIEFTPDPTASGSAGSEMDLVAADSHPGADFRPGDAVKATVHLKDGRVFDLDTIIAAPRPSVTLIDKGVQPTTQGEESHIRLVDSRDVPQDAKLTFSVRAQFPGVFVRDEKIEVATIDSAFSTTLAIGSGITLENSKVAVVTLDPAAAFGASASGPLRFRVTAGGAQGDWQPLATLVRLPVLRELACPETSTPTCVLSGSNLFLVEAVAGDGHFKRAVKVPDGYPGYLLTVPRPSGGRLYVRLRDDPSVVNAAEFPELGPRPGREAADPAAMRLASAPGDGPAATAAGETEQVPLDTRFLVN